MKQHEFESEIYKTLWYGAESYLAERNGKGASYYSQMLNPDDPRESLFFRAARDFDFLIQKNPEAGCKALRIFNTAAKASLPGDSSLCVESERRKAYKERNDFHLAEAEAKPLDDRIRELEESIEQDNSLLDALRAEAKREIQKDAFRGLTVSHGTRGKVVKVMNGRSS